MSGVPEWIKERMLGEPQLVGGGVFSEVKDSGERQEFETGSVRDSRAGKGRFDLLPPKAVKRLAIHFANGAVKYGDRNWEKGQPLTRYADSALRHLFAALDGAVDEDHLAAVAWNVMALMETMERITLGELPMALDDWPHDWPGRPNECDTIVPQEVRVDVHGNKENV